MTAIGRVLTFTRLGWRKQALFLEALTLVGLATVANRLLPFRWSKRLYGIPRPQSSDRDDRLEPAALALANTDIGDVRWALHMVHDRFGWDKSCLSRAIAGRIMLRRRGCTSTMYLGAYRGDAGDVKFHAWLRAYGVPVSGVRESHAFTTLAVFDGE